MELSVLHQRAIKQGAYTGARKRDICFVLVLACFYKESSLALFGDQMLKTTLTKTGEKVRHRDDTFHRAK